MLLLNIVILTVIAVVLWFITGKDKTISGESKRDRHLTRAIRCVIALFLLLAVLWAAENPCPEGVPILVFAPVMRSAISELFTHGFLGLLDPGLHDSQEIDLKKAQRYQDTIAHMIQHGHRDAAIKLCEEL